MKRKRVLLTALILTGSLGFLGFLGLPAFVETEAQPPPAATFTLTVHNDNCTSPNCLFCKPHNWIRVHVYAPLSLAGVCAVNGRYYSSATVQVTQGQSQTVTLEKGTLGACQYYHEAHGTTAGPKDVRWGIVAAIRKTSVTCKNNFLGTCQCK